MSTTETPGTTAASATPAGAAPRHLWDYWRIIWEGRRILGTVLGVTLAVAIIGTLLIPKRYTAEAQVEITLTQTVVLGAVTERSGAQGFFDVDREFKTEFVRIKAHKLLQKAIDDQHLLEKVPELAKTKQPVEILRRCITISREGQSKVMNIAVSWGDPEHAAILANAVADEYVDSGLEDRIEEMDRRIDRLRGSLTEKSAARRETLERELGIIRSGRSIDELLNLSTLKGNTALSKLNDELNSAKRELADLTGSMGFANPKVQSASARVHEAQSQLDAALAAATKDIETELTAAGGDPTQVVASNAPVSSVQQESDEKLEKELQSRVAQEEIIKRTIEPKAAVIDAALPPPKPSSPKWSLNILLALVVGLGFGGGLVFFRDYLDTTVKTIDDVERQLEMPLLAVIPLQISAAEAAAGGKSAAAALAPNADKIAKEAYQTLRTGLLFASGGRKDRILLITSSGPQEGKTSVVASLARAMAAAGESVVVLDADLRRAQLTREMGGSRAKGLSTYLADTSIRSWRDVVTQVEPNLELLPTGPLPPNPVDLLGMTRFRELLQELRGSHQWVLIDSPPVSSVSDPVLLASLVEMVLIVMRHDHTDKDVARRALQRLAGVGARLIGAVLNGVDMTKAYNREYYYGRFFYGSYYGQEEGDGGRPQAAAGGVERVRKMLR